VADHHKFKTGERATLDPFDAPAGDVPARDQRDLMERPFFSLAKTKRVQPILYKSGATEVQIYALAEHGMAIIWDADGLIWAASQILAAMRSRHSDVAILPPHALSAAHRNWAGNRQARIPTAQGRMSRLQSTVIRPTIRHGEHWRRQQFSWINEWEELMTRTGRCEGIEFVLPEWFYQGVLDRRLVLAIDPAYFALTGGTERLLYRVARKHAGRQLHGWRFKLRHLRAKSASLARYSDLALDVRRVVPRQPLLGYALAIEHASDGQEVIVMRAASTSAVDNLWMTDPGIGILGANHIGTSGAPVSGLRAHRSRSNDWNSAETQQRKDSKSESKFSVADAAHVYTNGRKHLAGDGDAS
jgi:plasmid replication initiation protein